MAITWGANTVHNIAATPANSGSSLFGGAAPAPGGLFGTPAPAPAPGGSLFGTPAPAPSLFGTPSPAPGGLFGAAPAPGGLFGSAPQQPTQAVAPQIPAQAALQAHRNASARNEEARVVERLRQLHEAYTSGSSTTPNGDSHVFTTVLYNPLTPQQRQLQAVQSSMMMLTDADGRGGQLLAPAKPAPVSDQDWNRACIRNPDPHNYLPTAIVGAQGLQARAVLHQEQADLVSQQVTRVSDTVEALRQRHEETQRQLEASQRRHKQQLSRLLMLVTRVEALRCFHLPLQPAELEARHRVEQLHRQTMGTLVPAVHKLAMAASPAETTRRVPAVAIEVPAEQQEQWGGVMKEHRKSLTQLTERVERDMEDVKLIGDRVMPRETIPVPRRM